MMRRVEDDYGVIIMVCIKFTKVIGARYSDQEIQLFQRRGDQM